MCICIKHVCIIQSILGTKLLHSGPTNTFHNIIKSLCAVSDDVTWLQVQSRKEKRVYTDENRGFSFICWCLLLFLLSHFSPLSISVYLTIYLSTILKLLSWPVVCTYCNSPHEMLSVGIFHFFSPCSFLKCHKLIANNFSKTLSRISDMKFPNESRSILFGSLITIAVILHFPLTEQLYWWLGTTGWENPVYISHRAWNRKHFGLSLL